MCFDLASFSTDRSPCPLGPAKVRSRFREKRENRETSQPATIRMSHGANPESRLLVAIVSAKENSFFFWRLPVRIPDFLCQLFGQVGSNDGFRGIPHHLPQLAFLLATRNFCFSLIYAVAAVFSHQPPISGVLGHPVPLFPDFDSRP
jgi:hypothetical protein